MYRSSASVCLDNGTRALSFGLLAVLVGACSNGHSSTGVPGATGGSLAAGGSSDVGGTAGGGGGNAVGGTAGSSVSGVGGSTGTGGSTSGAVGGAVGTGGATGKGGATSALGGAGGASTGPGGATGSGGATGTGGFVPASGGRSGTGGGTASGGGSPGGSGGANTGGANTAGTNGGGSTGQGGGTGGQLAGSGGSGAYNPCPSSGNPCKVLPLGDSITWGVNDEGNAGYRGPLFALAVAAQQKITFTGSLANGPGTVSGQTFPPKNEGHSGWGISTVTAYSNGVAGIATVIPSPAFDSGSGGLPNIILLHIGTNDTGDSTAAEMTSRLGGLMDKIVAAAPDAELVVAKIIPLSWATSVINAYNDAIPGLVQTRASAGKHVVLADMNTGFVSSTMMGSDSIHPNSSGYKFMADRWYSVIGPLLPK